ncbi:polysaccharide pyruvyl transferase family protein [Algoriphagus pacificus]|uniref:Polysaccharide pyruvyl transferase family protein n=1 Tax=Algoriphagus pacificus TaxID=2811234 RepID=A0ABS3CM09_9BACT|nr:polysaccharide pyruvyl transferase family protein [Algoriphagus pacificus]MBN7817526.1 polysaccharide pyruvyl transferase family protein [Algoriphagus pacificus]
MKRIFSKIKIKVYPKNIIDSINFLTRNYPLIFYWDYEKNWGDSINEFIFNSILKKNVYSSNKIFNIKNQEIITGIGSVLNSKLTNYSIWGSGFLSEKHTLIHSPNEVLAVRGKLTEKKINGLFRKSSDQFGDPGLLFKEFYHPTFPKEYKLGIIPHFKELDEKVIQDIKSKYGFEINIINPTIDIFKFADEVSKCESILSSSLHGLVLAESYGIPTARISISNKLIGGDFKFEDYYSGVNIPLNAVRPFNLLEHFDRNTIFSIPCTIKDLKYDSKGLINSLKSKTNII